MTMLQQERDHFTAHLAKWLQQYPGRVALVKEDRLVGVFDTEGQALSEGTRLFGLDTFLVRRDIPLQEAAWVPALALGLLNAVPTRTGPCGRAL